MNFPKKLTVTVCLLALGWLVSGDAFAQHHIGVRGGYGGGSARFYFKRDMAFWFGAPSGGISWKYYSAEPVVGGIQADLQFVTKGFTEYTTGSAFPEFEWAAQDSINYSRMLNAIELPFMWQTHLYAFKRHVRIYLNLGIYASYFLSSKEEIRNVDREVTVKRSYEMNSLRDNRFEYGLVGGFGISFLFKNRLEAFVEARYSFGYSDILKNQTKYPPNYRVLRSPIDMLNVSAGVYYRLGKGGILAPPPGSNRTTESWDSIPVGRPPAQGGTGSQGGSGSQGNQSSPAGRGTQQSPTR